MAAALVTVIWLPWALVSARQSLSLGVDDTGDDRNVMALQKLGKRYV